MKKALVLLLLGGCTVHVETSPDAARLIGLGVVAGVIYGYDPTLGNLRCR